MYVHARPWLIQKIELNISKKRLKVIPELAEFSVHRMISISIRITKVPKCWTKIFQSTSYSVKQWVDQMIDKLTLK